LFCNVRPERVIPALNLATIYDAPTAYHEAGLDEQVLKVFGIDDAPAPLLSRWENVVERVTKPEGTVKIAVVGKYMQVRDSYKSLTEALTHGGLANNVRVEVEWIESETFEKEDSPVYLEDMNGILVPGGFGERGAEGKVAAAKFARERRVPYFGICFGMQMAVIEAARNLAGLEGAGSTEFVEGGGRPPKHPVICLMTEWVKDDLMERRSKDADLGGTMRLGAYDAVLAKGSRVAEIYGTEKISERHRHRFEVNIAYRERLEASGLVFSGLSPDGLLPEIVEIPSHPWFIGVQFHPELKSKPLDPHPLFASFIQASVRQSRLV
jgi:CTP synthase